MRLEVYMNGFCKLLALMMALFVFTTHAKADAFEIGKFVLGALSSVAVHELGHAAVAEARGGDVTKIELFKGGSLSGATHITNFDKLSRKDAQYIYASGLLATSLATEVIIRNENLHDKSFAQGMLAVNLLSNASYVYNFYTQPSGKDDIDLYEANDGNPHVFNALLLAHTLYSIYRIDHDTNIVPYVKRNLIGISVDF
ncbi:MAG: M50 family metallopeptidase [Ghiorsea sp.]|nr:M50 family metallopeptidase [Ghiorsea sp.]